MNQDDAAKVRCIAERIDSVPAVVRRSGGIAGTVAAYLPSDRVVGLRVGSEGLLQIHVVMSWGYTVDDVEAQVLKAVQPDWNPARVELTIDDIEEPAPTPPQPSLPVGVTQDPGRSLPMGNDPIKSLPRAESSR